MAARKVKPKLGTLWQGYCAWLSNGQARQAFTARYGREPMRVWRVSGCVYAGPITKAEHNGKTEQAKA